MSFVAHLTFDGAVNKPGTLHIMQALQEMDVKATFFVEGHRIRDNEKVLQEIKNRGHHLGNHSFTHPNFDELTVEQGLQEIEKADEALFLALGFRTKLVRPPSGILPQEHRDALEAKGYQINLWSISVKDWLGPDANAVAERTITQCKGQDVTVVYHDHLPWTADVVRLVVPQLQAKGYSIKPIAYPNE